MYFFIVQSLFRLSDLASRSEEEKIKLDFVSDCAKVLRRMFDKVFIFKLPNLSQIIYLWDMLIFVMSHHQRIPKYTTPSAHLKQFFPKVPD